jgi:serine/threonine-protein kinase RsbW
MVSTAGAQQPWVSVPGESAGGSGALRLPHTAFAVSAARRRIRADLAAGGVSRSLLDDIEVVVSELLANAVRHARPVAGSALLAGWQLTGPVVTVKVTDGGSLGRVEPRGTGVLAETGRGLRIVDGLAAEWGVVDHIDGLRTVWATLIADGGCPARQERHTPAVLIHRSPA